MSNSIDLKKVKRWCPELVTRVRVDPANMVPQEARSELFLALNGDIDYGTKLLPIAHRVQSLGDVVEKYAQHKPDCALGYAFADKHECNCGYDEAIAALKGAV